MSAAPDHAILVGGGIGGLTAALALADRGARVSVIERSPVLEAVGAGVQLSPNATRLLFQLGLEAAVRAIAFAPQAAEVRDHVSGRLLLRTPLGAAGEQRWGAPYLQVHRADLQAVLVEAVQNRAGVRLQLGARLTGIEADAAGVVATIATDAADHRSARAEVLVGCDGIRSTVRGLLWGEHRARFTGQTAWRGLVDADRLDMAAIAPAAMVWTGAGRHFVHYPVRGGALVNFVGVVARRDWTAETWTDRGDRTALEADFRNWPEPVRALVAAMPSPWRYAIYDRPPLATWSRGRVSLLGDAAHAAPPFLAQGAAMAIEDGEALARHLTSGLAAPAALELYEEERRPRTRRVQAWSRRNARLFHLPGPMAQAVFGTAAGLDQLSSALDGARLDWLYGYRPPKTIA